MANEHIPHNKLLLSPLRGWDLRSGASHLPTAPKQSVRQTHGDITMNWEAIGAISETIGAAGVITTLLYLSLQVRASTRASAVESKLVSASFQIDFLKSLVQDPELQEIMLRGRKDPISLSVEEYYRFSNLVHIAFGSFSAAHFQFRQGTVSESDFFENLVTIRYFLWSAGGRQWWEKIGKYMFGPEFVAVIEAEIEGAQSA